MLIYNDMLGAIVSFAANILGWTALLLIAGVGVWRSAMYVIRRGREVAAAARREWREALTGENG